MLIGFTVHDLASDAEDAQYNSGILFIRFDYVSTFYYGGGFGM